MLLLFSLFHVICFLRTGCFFHVICFIKTGGFKCCLFCLLSILCFVVKNDLRRKISFRFFSKIQYAASDVTFFPFFASYVSSEVVVFFTSYVSSKLVDSNVWCLVYSFVKQCHQFQQNLLICEKLRIYFC